MNIDNKETQAEADRANMLASMLDMTNPAGDMVAVSASDAPLIAKSLRLFAGMIKMGVDISKDEQ